MQKSTEILNNGYKIWQKDAMTVWVKDPTRTILRLPDESKLIEQRLRIGRELRRQEKRDNVISKLIIWIIIWIIWMLLMR